MALRSVAGVVHSWDSQRKTRLSRLEVRGRSVLADQVTGTLYCPITGECLTSAALRVVL